MVLRRAAASSYYPGIDASEYRDVIGRFTTGVTIVTCHGDGLPAGLTTNAVTSLSLDPLLLLVCFDNTSRTLPVVRESRRFAVNVLRAGQEDLAAAFASKRVAEEKFASVTHTVAHGVPVLDDALAWVACELVELLPGGDHTIGIGSVIDGAASEGEPLVFFRGRYATGGTVPGVS
jgi:flavin reductase (DIM6/NTAB) family NADH-FMN oxidoreductase RutF